LLSKIDKPAQDHGRKETAAGDSLVLGIVLPGYPVTTTLLHGGEQMMYLLKKLVRDDSGQDLIEYALIAALLALAAVTTMGNLATSINGIFTSVAGKLVAP
jgi:pilus assembly protein Flp/PilA